MVDSARLSRARPAQLPASLFVSHGPPTLALGDLPARAFLVEQGARLPAPRAFLVASAHWESVPARVAAAPAPETIHDFHGFPAELYAMRYPAPGAPRVAAEVIEACAAAGLECAPDEERGLDHGAWVPLALLRPAADVPVLQISIPSRGGPQAAFDLGRALAPLTARGVLVLGSGGVTHNLGEYRGQGPDASVPEWVSGFSDWLASALERRALDELLDYRRRASHGVRSHPSEEHILPLFVALGAAGPRWRARRVHASAAHGVLAMDAYAFE
jgi:4,5-DOPA dioxygenase extradiol